MDNKKRILGVIGKLQLLSIVTLIASPFLWIWGDGMFAAKVAGSAVLGIAVMWFANEVMKQVFQGIEQAELDGKHEGFKKTMKKSKWQEKLEEIQKKQRN